MVQGSTQNIQLTVDMDGRVSVVHVNGDVSDVTNTSPQSVFVNAAYVSEEHDGYSMPQVKTSHMYTTKVMVIDI